MLRILFRHFCLVFFIIYFFWPKIIFASDTLKLISPLDNSSESKPKLIWEYLGQCKDSSSCFRVEVDNNSDFNSPEKSTYTNSFSYSPQGLPDGIYFWHVKAKDNSGAWSDWSQPFRFNIGSSIPAPQFPQPSQTPQSPSPTSVSESKSNNNKFEIKDIPKEVNSDQDFEISVTMNLTDKTNTKFHLKGAFKKVDSSNYFGQTFVSNSWIQNNSSYSAQFSIDTDKNGFWEGKIKVRPDIEDSGFKGTGDYVFKVARYTDSGVGPTWSNELSLKINEVATPKPSPSMQTTDETITEEEEPDLTASIVRAAKPSRNYEIKIASVAGEATMSDNTHLVPKEEQVKVLKEKKVNWLLIILGGIILISALGFGVYKIKSK